MYQQGSVGGITEIRAVPRLFVLLALVGLCILVVITTTNSNSVLVVISNTNKVKEVDFGTTQTLFHNAHTSAYQLILNEESTLRKKDKQRKNFNLTEWISIYNRSSGGLTRKDQQMLGDMYRASNSVFEFGLGESTGIANYVGVPRYAGVDSHVDWVNNVRSEVSPTFRFYYSDVGAVGAWGYPVQNLTKAILTYQIGPLASEIAPFDVYMVDGRFRVGCVLVSFLHAASYGSYDSLVLLHDCYHKDHSPSNPPPSRNRKAYYVLNDYFDLHNHSKDFLCVYKRRQEVTDEQIYQLWEKYHAVTE